MWVPKWYWEAKTRQINELERRVKRLELMLLTDAERTIEKLMDEEYGTGMKSGFFSIEETIKRKRADLITFK